MKLFSKGTLAKKANAFKKINSSILLGSLEEDELTDVEIVTLKQYARDCAYSDALGNYNGIDSYEDINEEVARLLETKFTKANEFVSIEEERIVVGVNAEVVDDRAVDRAMLMLVDLENYDKGSYHIVGEPIHLTIPVDK